MMLTTERLTLRPWRDGDAQALYEYAKDPRVGPAAGWPAHTDVQESRRIIQGVLSAPETYAVVLKNGPDTPVGAVGLTVGVKGNRDMGARGGEIGYWIGVPFWGHGYIPEGVRALMRRAFLDLGLETLWCGCYEGNEKSRRVQDKCGFVYHHTEPDKLCELLGERRTEHVSRLTRAEWENREGERAPAAPRPGEWVDG